MEHRAILFHILKQVYIDDSFLLLSIIVTKTNLWTVQYVFNPLDQLVEKCGTFLVVKQGPSYGGQLDKAG